MSILKNKKLVLGVVIIVLIVGFVLWSRSSTPTFEDDILLVPEGGVVGGPGVGSAAQSAGFFLQQISQLQGISFDNMELLTAPAFTNLEDNTVELPEFPVGRNNPFAPIGADDDTLFSDIDGEGTSEASQ